MMKSKMGSFIFPGAVVRKILSYLSREHQYKLCLAFPEIYNNFYKILHKRLYLYEKNFKFICQKCGLRFKDNEWLLYHETSHFDTGFNQFYERFYLKSNGKLICTFCGKVYCKKCLLLAHITQKHAKIICRICGKFYVGSNRLSAHFKRCKLMRKKFVCGMCGERFHKKDKNRHQLMHFSKVTQYYKKIDG